MYNANIQEGPYLSRGTGGTINLCDISFELPLRIYDTAVVVYSSTLVLSACRIEERLYEQHGGGQKTGFLFFGRWGVNTNR